jgi:hypothetical protein
MKKTLLFAALLIGGLSQLSAQCTIMPSCTTSTLGYCTSPAENTNLPNGTELSPYSTTIQFSLGTTVGGFVTITDATISSVTGMPAGFTYSTNPVSGNFPGGSNACLILDGTPAAASAGTYTVAATFAVNTSFGPTTQTLSWYLTIDPVATGIKSYTQLSDLFISPNPATSELNITSAAYFKKVTIIDALGKVVISKEVDNTASIKVDVNALTKGVYFIQATDGDKQITRKFIKD